ncbi:polysaccharide deacetylase family protein [Streptomyces sp. NPDC047028]|uniref:polysaccharide deacetylase family protein n=1 Tax=Streptomyces sp. NPDC047028 TaxID=3155793 RepID=UPI003400C1D6
MAAVLAAATLLLAGCAQSVDPIERLGKKAAERVRPDAPVTVPGQAYRHWGLTAPLARPPLHPARPLAEFSAAPGTAAGPPVVDRVPTRDKVVFLTYDDGAGQDPRFADMVRELRLPVSMFLTDRVLGPGYGHFARLRSVGAGIQNQTLEHRALTGLPYAGQRAEICGQQDKLRSRFGIRPHLFRPPYGTYDTTTLRAAADCGITAVVLWRATTTPSGLTYRQGEHTLRPGDIIHVRGPALRVRTSRVLRRVEERGLAVGRLEDYL